MEVQDVITKFKGYVTELVTYITGCNQALVQPQVDEKGAYVSSMWFDVDRLVPTGKAQLHIEVSTAGPDYQAPIK